MRPNPFSRFTSRFARKFTGSVLLAACALGATLPAHAEVKVGLSDWPGWVAWYVAEQKGFFKKHGANVRLVWFPNYSDSVAALSSGQLDANAQTWSDTMTPLSRNLNVKVVLVNDNSAGNDALMVNPKIRSFADLKGKTVALEHFSVSHFVLVNALARHGMKASDVKLVNLGAADAAAAFMTGRVDAAVVWNPWIARIQASGKGKALFTSKDMPGMVADLLVAHGKALGDKTKRADLVGMIKAWMETEAFIRTNQAEALQIMSKVVGMKPDEYRVFLPGTRFFNGVDNLAAFDPKHPQSLVAVGPAVHQFLSQNKLVTAPVNYAGALDPSLLADALRK
ncbi:ABC transporter substrate-binding protein [Pseudoduganella umbonata]|uniref:Aliphatic sulfonate ABC transporter substrate-binding protein n=1 Tax=Pseudoduganella umbonata TaxID=864828 RepID=A0A4P8HPL8_9BURK|nr:ABC transporter substrate-binding protein [Pseudoduganella umbonata]MBB3221273.1 NitT/TauT family transport system substrate-binding protein [Pseudoduganella umbonata]QCP10448.1 aliphatic sulfonate ABC transporter substrate-binding protein [Pseudoduganella umbonata]